jgi:hypothetical protein
MACMQYLFFKQQQEEVNKAMWWCAWWLVQHAGRCDDGVMIAYFSFIIFTLFSTLQT